MDSTLRPTIARNLLLALVLLGLSSFAYWFEYSRKPREEAKTEAAKRVFGLGGSADATRTEAAKPVSNAQVSSIALSGGTKLERLRLECSEMAAKLCRPSDAGKWRVSVPAQLGADESNVSAFLTTLAGLTAGETIDLATETAERRAALLREYGLDSAARALPKARRIEVSYQTESGEARSEALVLGEVYPVGGQILGLREVGGVSQEQTVYLLPSYVNSYFDYPLTHWRNKKVTALNLGQVTECTLQGSQGSISATKKDGAWTLNTGLPGDREQIDSLIGSLVYATAKEFTAERKTDPAAARALAGAKLRATLTLNQSRFELWLKAAPKAQPGQPAQAKAWIKSSELDPLFEVEASLADRIDRKPRELRYSKILNSEQRFAITQVRISSPAWGPKASPRVFTQKDSQWSGEGSAKVVELLDQLAGNRIEDYVALANAPAVPADALMLVFEGGGKSLVELRFWRQGKELWARPTDAQARFVYRMESALAQKLPWSEDFFKPEASGAPVLPTASAPPGSKESPPSDDHGHVH